MRNKSREEYFGFSVRKQKRNILGTNVENPLRRRQFGVLSATNARRNAFPITDIFAKSKIEETTLSLAATSSDLHREIRPK